MDRIAVVFAGQGAQKPGMGRSLYEHVPEARAIFDEAETIMPGILKMCFEGPKDVLDETVNTQPCVLTCDVAAWAAFSTLGIRPYAGAGFSLGEYAALCAAGVVNFSTALKIVIRRAQWMHEEAQAVPGGMAAVLGLEAKEVEDIVHLVRQSGVLRPVNYNCPGQTVVAGDTAELDALISYGKEHRLKIRPLAVSGAFHTERMHEAARKTGEYIEALDFAEPEFILYANRTAVPYEAGPDMKETLSSQTENPVLFEQIVRNLLDEGVATFVELGPGTTLSGFIKRMDRSARIMHVDDYDSLLLTKEALK